MSTSETTRFTLRNLPVAARLTIAVFLVSVGVGYFSALVQLHFQHARPGEMMPSGDDAVDIFTTGPKNQKKISRLEQLLIADEKLTFGKKQMSAAFTERSTSRSKWEKLLKKRGDALRKEREGEREGVLAWIRAGADKNAYEKDRFLLPDEM